MARNPSDIVSLTEIKEELDLPQTHVSEDDKLTRHIHQAIEITQSMLGRVLLDREAVFYASFPRNGDGMPLLFYGRDIVFDSANDKLEYWDSSATLAEAPNQSITDIGRFVKTPDGLVLYRQSPWPIDALDAKARLTTTVGGDVPYGLRAAIISLARHFYGGFEKVPDSYGVQISPYRRVTPQEAI